MILRDISGLDLTASVREAFGENYVYIIMIASSWDEASRTDALEAGVDDFIRKSPDRAHLFVRLRVAERLIRHENLLAEKHRKLECAHKQIEKDINAAAEAQRQLVATVNCDMRMFLNMASNRYSPRLPRCPATCSAFSRWKATCSVFIRSTSRGMACMHPFCRSRSAT